MIRLRRFASRLQAEHAALTQSFEGFLLIAHDFFRDYDEAITRFETYVPRKDKRRLMVTLGELVDKRNDMRDVVEAERAVVEERQRGMESVAEERDTAMALMQRCKKETQRLAHMLFALKNLIMERPPEVCEQLMESPFPFEGFARFLIPMFDATTGTLHFNIDAFQTPEFITMLRFQEFSDETINLLLYMIGRLTCPPKTRERHHIGLYMYGASGVGKSVFSDICKALHEERSASIASTMQEGFGAAEQVGSGDKQARVMIFADLTP